MRNEKRIIFAKLFLIFILFTSFKVALSQKDSPFNLEKSLPKGYVKDGSVDYTKEIQSSLDMYRHVIFPDFPVLINDVGLKVKSNSKIEFQKNSLVKLMPSVKKSYNVFELTRVENVDLINVRIWGDKDTHLGKEGADGHGISIRSSKNINVINPIVEKCWGDGILVGGLIKPRNDPQGRYYPSENVVIRGGLLNHNRRNGLSIMSVKNILVENLESNNNKGAFPMAGIDIEPNYNKDYMENVILKNIVTRNNRYGIQIVLKKLVGEKSNNVDIQISNHVDYKSQIGLRFDKMDRKGQVLGGTINITNSKWFDNKSDGISFEKDQEHLSKVVLKNVQVLKNDRVVPINLVQPKGRITILK